MFNRMKTICLLAVLTALFLLIGKMIGGSFGMIIAAGFAVLMNFGAYWWSDKIILKMYRAEAIGERDDPELFGMVEMLAMRAGIPMPKVYVIPEAAPNAFATGRNPKNAAVAVTQGIKQILNRDELFGVLAHEIGHIKNRDTLVMTVAGGIAGAISMIAEMAFWSSLFGNSDDEESNSAAGFLGVLIAPFAAMLIQMAISRSREFIADEEGSKLSGNPLALASALRKIEAWSAKAPIRSGNQATAHLFIINPFSAASIGKLFSTHPATELRIKKLEAMDRGELAQKIPAFSN